MPTLPMPTSLPRLTERTIQRALVVCGILATLLFVGMNVFIPMQWAEYSLASQTVSELSAIDAPTRSIWVPFGLAYGLLMLAFGVGVVRSAGSDRRLRIAGALLFVYAAVGFAGPPMHQREVLAAGGQTLTDTLHIAFTFVTVVLMMAAIGLAAAALGARFRRYSIATLAALVGFGVLTSVDAAAVEANQPTPWIGIWERLDIAAFLLWVVVLAVALLRRPHAPR